VSRAGRARFLSWRAALAVALLVGVCGTISASGAGAAASSATRIVTAAPRLPGTTRVLGAVRADAIVSGAVVLRPRNNAALKRFIAAASDKTSPRFRHYLAPGQFAARFGPTASSVTAVTDQLRADGLAVSVAPNGLLIHFSGSATHVEQAFGVGLDRVRLPGGATGRVRTAPVRLPATIAGLVTSVVGLDNVLRLHPAARFGSTQRAPQHAAPKPIVFPHPAGSPTPCSDAQSAATGYGGLTDDQIAHSYGAFGLYGENDLGAGQSIAVFELEPFDAADIQTFDKCYFGATAAAAMATRLTTVPVDGGLVAGAGSGESLLDIEDVSALAPGANIDVYEAPNTTFGSLDEWAAIINNDTDQVVSSSWGLCEQAVEQGEPGVLEAENLLFEQAAAQGQSIFVATGDEGSNDCNAFFGPSPVSPILSQDDPASQPYVVGVGGTTIDNPSQPAEEHVWNDGPVWGAGGGGISQAWPMPSWQLAASVPGIHDAATFQGASTFEAGELNRPGYAFCQTDNPAGVSQAACRQVPDVSAEADEFTGAITVYAGSFGGWQTYGGTSSATPIWAALLAVTNESPTCRANSVTGNGVGFVSPLLYSVASDPTAYAASFNDVTQGNNDAFGASGFFSATAGYDMASGLGSPMLTQPNGGAGLAYYLCTGAGSVARPTVTSVNTNVTLTSASSTSVTITGTNFANGGGSNVAQIQVGDYVLPAGTFTVTSPTTITATFPAAAKVVPPQAGTDGAGHVQVVVTLDDGESSAPGAGSVFTYVDGNGGQKIPSVTSIGPYGGPEAGGNTVIIYGAGFIGATSVKFGGVNATSFTVVHDWEISATVPPYAAGATTCVKNGSTYGTGEDATNDVCQTQVVVANSHGSSKTQTILPLYEGDAAFNALGIIPPPPGEESGPATTEYDYFPAPTITSISTDNGPFSLASENGGTVITIKGTGFNFAGLEWVAFGDPTDASSQSSDLVTVTGTEIQIVAPELSNTTVDPVTLGVTVQTIAGQTGTVNATYAGIPSVVGVTVPGGPKSGAPAGPSTGGTPIAVAGEGFANQLLGLQFVDSAGTFSLGTQYQFTANSDTALTSTTVAQNPGVVDVEACTVTGCSDKNDPLDQFLLYPPGNPKISSIKPQSGPANGGTSVTITGANLGCVTRVYFGTVLATKVSNAVALLDCGSTTQVTVVAPPGKAGTKVRVRLMTVESDFSGFGLTKSTLHFRYTTPKAQLLAVGHSGYGSGRIKSTPAGINCGSACSHRFPYGTVVTLTATPRTGSKFIGWIGACGHTKKPQCTFKMTTGKSIRAAFDH
jgi:hypothetical protein